MSVWSNKSNVAQRTMQVRFPENTFFLFEKMAHHLHPPPPRDPSFIFYFSSILRAELCPNHLISPQSDDHSEL